MIKNALLRIFYLLLVVGLLSPVAFAEDVVPARVMELIDNR